MFEMELSGPSVILSLIMSKHILSGSFEGSQAAKKSREKSPSPGYWTLTHKNGYFGATFFTHYLFIVYGIKIVPGLIQKNGPRGHSDQEPNNHCWALSIKFDTIICSGEKYPGLASTH